MFHTNHFNDKAEENVMKKRILAGVMAAVMVATMVACGSSGGEMPDVFWMHSNNAAKYMGSGVLLNMDSYIEKDETIVLNNYFDGITEL